ncbi:DNA topoisomerase IV, subunit B [Anopheles sinensis]|uniref:DNA topoisomerase IV, subunit B n=1 Tax=Anopheles sinensis TaxID=74873 RepID=A0A084WL70_ANOSI|nr:DNA topoisomerase IV, subunit B [Anopheles sinensis]
MNLWAPRSDARWSRTKNPPTSHRTAMAARPLGVVPTVLDLSQSPRHLTAASGTSAAQRWITAGVSYEITGLQAKLCQQ